METINPNSNNNWNPNFRGLAKAQQMEFRQNMGSNKSHTKGFRGYTIAIQRKF